MKNDKIKNFKKSSILYCNIRGIIPGLRRDKMTYLSTISDELNAQYILLTETHLSDVNSEAETFLPGWNQIRSDRKIRQKGGSLIYVRDQITVESTVTFSNSFVELVTTFIPSQNLALINIYRPPATPAAKFTEAINVIDKWIVEIENKLAKTPNIFIAGDLNFPGMGAWSSKDMDSASTNAITRANKTGDLGNNINQVRKLIDIVTKYSLSQIVKLPTRLENILDLMFTNNTELIDSIETIENIKVTDHKLVVAHLISKTQELREESRKNFCSTSIPLYNLLKTSPDQWQKAREELSTKDFDKDTSPTKMMDDLIVALEDIVKVCFNKPSLPSRSDSSSKNIIPKHARQLMRRKLNISRAITKEQNVDKKATLKDKILAIEEELRKSVHQMRAKKELLARSNLIVDPNKLHDLVKQLNKKSTKIGPFKGKDIPKNISDVEILSRQYSNVFTTPKRENIFNDPETFFRDNEIANNNDSEDNPNNENLKEFTVTEEQIKNAIDSLPPKAAPGPDGVPNILIKQLKHELSPILLTIFAKSLKEGEIPESFLKAFIKPVKKPMKSRSDPSSYRPLSLTSNIAKLLEKVVKSQLENYMENKNILSEAQHGFRSKHSCLSQLLKHYNEVIESLEAGQTHDVIYLDFSKAFDTVDRYILSRHMLNAGISSKAATWIFRFLNNRTQQVISDNSISSPAPVRSGVPQGTVLGPQLFLLMINSLTDEDLSSKIGIFADDTRVGRGISKDEDIDALQKDLDTIFAWKESNNMCFNSDKFILVRHGATFKSSKNIPQSEYYTDEQELIPNKSTVRDLGILVSASSDFHDQILRVCKTARDKSNWMFRSKCFFFIFIFF